MALLALSRITGDAATTARAAEVLAGSEARPRVRARTGRASATASSLRTALEQAERSGATALAASARDALIRTGADRAGRR